MLSPCLPVTVSSWTTSLYLIYDAFAYAEQHLYLPNRCADFHNFKISKAELDVNNSNRIQPAVSLFESYVVLVGDLVQSNRAVYH